MCKSTGVCATRGRVAESQPALEALTSIYALACAPGNSRSVKEQVCVS